MIARLFRRRRTADVPLASIVRHHRIGVNVTGDAIETARNRLTLSAGLFALAFIVIGLRLVDVTLLRGGSEPALSAATGGSGIPAERAEILDRNGVVLATSIPTASLYANPRLVLDADDAAHKLAAVLPDSDEKEFAEKLKSDKSFVWLRRNLAPREQQRVNALGVPGLDFQSEDRRIYPQGELTAQVVGYAGVDNVGLSGAEQYFDSALRNGEPVTLSIDIRLQRMVTEDLRKAIAKFDAIGGAGVVLDVRTGEILSMVSLPTFDPNSPKTIDEDSRFNRVTQGVYEMGSTFKVFNTAMALDSGKVSMTSSFDATAPLKIDRFTIHDDHAQNRWLTVPEIIKYSSNIGSARMALEVGGDVQRAFFERIGFLKPLRIELPEAAAPMYPDPWRKINTMTIAYGHGIAVTPLHLATGVAGVVNGGIMYTPTLLRRSDTASLTGERIVTAQTSRNLRQLMRLVVEEGTGKKAEVAGYLPGGKTGTAEKVGAHGGYRKKSLLSTFVGAFPMSDPRYVVLISVDEPKGNKESFGYATAGWVAAPPFADIVSDIAALYGMPPVQPVPPAAARKPSAPSAGISKGGSTVASN